MIKINSLNQYYSQSHTLKDVSLNIDTGESLCLMGRNGMGKTTLIKCLMGLLPIRSGDILYQQIDLSRQPAYMRARLGIGYVPQGRDIFSKLTVFENLIIGLGLKSANQDAVLEEIFKLFPVLKKMLRRRGGDLSGGQQQQLAIGRALVLNPKMLILDEPTEGIQPNLVHEIGDLIIRLNQEKKITILLVEQKLAFVKRVTKSFAILENGKIVAGGKINMLTDSIIKQHLMV